MFLVFKHFWFGGLNLWVKPQRIKRFSCTHALFKEHWKQHAVVNTLDSWLRSADFSQDQSWVGAAPPPEGSALVNWSPHSWTQDWSFEGVPSTLDQLRLFPWDSTNQCPGKNDYFLLVACGAKLSWLENTNGGETRTDFRARWSAALSALLFQFNRNFHGLVIQRSNAWR